MSHSSGPYQPMNPSAHGNFSPRRPAGPRKVRHGVKLTGILQDQSQSDAEASSELPGLTLARRFLSLLESSIEPAPFAEGLEYAKSGQTVNLDFHPGRIEAHIQGTAPKAYLTKLHFPTFSSEQWQRVIGAMGTEAVHVAKVLAGELPPTLDDLLSAQNPPLALLPQSGESISTRCTCPLSLSGGEFEPGPRCKHAAAAACIAAEKLAQQPLLIFTLLGMPAEQLLEQLRQARTIETHGMASAHRDASFPESQLNSLPLEACIDDFWRSPSGHDLREIENAPASHHVPHALLRRLGPSPMNGRFPLVGLLASVYDSVADAARKLRDS